MSRGRKKTTSQVLVTVTTEEFGEICQRVHRHLLDRAEDAQHQRDQRATKRAIEKQVDTAKDLFVFTHLMSLVDSMTDEIAELRSIIEGMGAEFPEEEDVLPEMYSTPKKQFVN